MQTERHYKIEKYLEMARLTRNGDKKESFIDAAQTYLEMRESEFAGVVCRVPYIQDVLTQELVVNRKPADVYQEYLFYCDENGEITVGKNTFFKEVEMKLKVRRKKIRSNDKQYWIFSK